MITKASLRQIYINDTQSNFHPNENHQPQSGVNNSRTSALGNHSYQFNTPDKLNYSYAG